MKFCLWTGGPSHRNLSHVFGRGNVHLAQRCVGGGGVWGGGGGGGGTLACCSFFMPVVPNGGWGCVCQKGGGCFLCGLPFGRSGIVLRLRFVVPTPPSCELYDGDHPIFVLCSPLCRILVDSEPTRAPNDKTARSSLFLSRRLDLIDISPPPAFTFLSPMVVCG